MEGDDGHADLVAELHGTSGLRDIDGVPILDTAGALVKMTELMVDLDGLGVSRSRKGFYTSLPKDDLIRVRKSYGIE